MAGQVWFVDKRGIPQSWREKVEMGSRPYRLYHFLKDLDEVLERYVQDYKRLQAISRLSQRLLHHATWLKEACPLPDPNVGWSVMMLYDDPTYVQTVQLVGWAVGSVSPVHNHATWGVVALLQGQEKNTFWQQDEQGAVHQVGELVLNAGDILCLASDAIHHVEVLGDQPTYSLNLYGETRFSERYQFDPVAQTYQKF